MYKSYPIICIKYNVLNLYFTYFTINQLDLRLVSSLVRYIHIKYTLQNL